MHSYDTIHQLTCLGTSQQNGKAEGKFRHILDTIRALLLSAKVLTHFWGEIALHAVYAINRIPSPVIQNQTPYEYLFGSPPHYHHLSISNLSLNLDFVVFLAMLILKMSISVMILSFIVFVFPTMLSCRL